MRRHHDQVSVLGLGCLQNRSGWIALNQCPTNRECFNLRATRLSEFLFGLAKNLREQIPGREVAVIVRHTPCVTSWRHHVQHCDLCLKTFSQSHRLLNDPHRSGWRVYRQKDFLDQQGLQSPFSANVAAIEKA